MDDKNNKSDKNPMEVQSAKIKLSKSILANVINTMNQFEELSNESDTEDS